MEESVSVDPGLLAEASRAVCDVFGVDERDRRLRQVAERLVSAHLRMAMLTILAIPLETE